MPTIALKVQQNGRYQGWFSLTGGVFGYQTIDDSDGTTHDSGTSFLRLPRIGLFGVDDAGTVSFPLFLQAEGLVPTSITLNVVAQKVGVISHPRIKIGFQRGGSTGFDATMFDPPASWSLAQRTFSTNPITGGPWSVSDLVGLEACLQSETGVAGNNDVTLVSGSMDYYPVTNTRIGVSARRGL